MGSNTTRHRIVIVGGGAGGLQLACRLGDGLGRRGRAEITLVDPSLTHLWKPLLHEVAAGTLDSHADAIDFFAQARGHCFRFRLGRMEALDRERKLIRLAPAADAAGFEVSPPQTVAYDTLVLAVGSTINDFGVPGVHEHCALLDTQQHAEHFHSLFLRQHLRAHLAEGPLHEDALSMGIVGAGATGVELAAELHAASRQLVAYGLDRILPERDARIALVEAAERVLPGLPQRIARVTERRLHELGIAIHCGEQVSRVTGEGLETTSGRFIPCGMKVWAAGIRAPEFLSRLDGLESNRLNQLVVRPTLQATVRDDIFAFGDCAQCPWPGRATPVPPRAQAAQQQAMLLARSLARVVRGGPPLEFAYQDRGSLVSLSRYTTLGTIMGNLLGQVTFEGWLARIAYRSLYRRHQRTVHGTPRTLLVMLADWFRRGAGPALKLH